MGPLTHLEHWLVIRILSQKVHYTTDNYYAMDSQGCQGQKYIVVREFCITVGQGISKSLIKVINSPGNYIVKVFY